MQDIKEALNLLLTNENLNLTPPPPLTISGIEFPLKNIPNLEIYMTNSCLLLKASTRLNIGNGKE